MPLPPGYYRDLLGYGSLFSNSVASGVVPSAELLQTYSDSYGHLFNFENADQISDYYTNQDPISFDEFGSIIGSGLDSLLGQAASDLTNFSGLDFNSLIPEGGLFSPSGQPSNYNNASGVGSGALSPSTSEYLNAELAKFYGMDRNTAYQEALSNTAYQRAVADMQRAGLNPAAIFGNGRGSTAGGVGYVGSAGSASSFGSGSGSKLFSADDFGLIASLAGLATAVVTKKPHNFWLGQQGAQAVMTTLNGLNKKFK